MLKQDLFCILGSMTTNDLKPFRPTYLLFIGIFLLSAQAQAQSQWDINYLAPSAKHGTETITLDVDDDGDLDVVTSRFITQESSNNPVSWTINNETLEWYENEGDNTFEKRHSIEKGLYGLGELLATDINGDNLEDLICSCAPDSSGLAWFPNTGSGGFGDAILIAHEPVGTAQSNLADIDGDGDFDLWWVSNYEDQAIRWAANESGAFAPAADLSLSPFEEAVFFAIDLNDDALVDLLRVTEYSMSRLDNQGSGIFSEPELMLEGSFDIEKLDFLDIDGDGRVDFCYDSDNDHNWLWMRNQGNNSFAPSLPLISSALAGTKSIESADLDGDGDLDIVSVDVTQLKTYLNDGQENFSYESSLQGIVNYHSKLQVEDMDGDGDLDIIALAIGNPKNVYCYDNYGSGNYSVPRDVSADCDGAICSALGDINGDGKNDVLAANIYGKLQWFEVDTEGDFSSKHLIDYDIYDIETIDLVDIDGDLDLDIIVAVLFADNWTIHRYLNDGSGQFIGPYDLGLGMVGLIGNVSFRLQYHDLDEDGDLDIIVRQGDTEMSWHENDGSGNFVLQHTICAPCDISTGENLYSFQLADIDGDMDMDIVYHSNDPFDNVYLYRVINEGAGYFQEEQLIIDQEVTTSNGELFGFALGDIDGDADMDIIMTLNQELQWAENDGAGHYPLIHHSGQTSMDSYDIQLADFDYDGDNDVVLSQWFTPYGMKYLENLAMGTFAPVQNFYISALTGFLDIGFINDDEAIDIVSVNFDRGYVPTMINPCGILPESPVISESGGIYTVEYDSLLQYQWFDDGVLLPGETSWTLNPDSAGNYYVQVSDSNRCKAVSDTLSFTSSLTEWMHRTKRVSAFPNPTTDHVNFVLDEASLPDAYQVYDIYGRELSRGSVNNVTPRLSVDHWTSGIYTVVFYRDGHAVGHALLAVD